MYEGIPHPVMCRKIRYYQDKHFTKRLLPKVEIPKLTLGGEMKTKKALQAVTAAASIALAASCASQSATMPATSGQEATVMTSFENQDASNSPRSAAEEVGRRFLELIEGLESRDDLSLERIQDAMGVMLAPGVKGSFYYSKRLDGGWIYLIEYIPQSPSLKEGVALTFDRLRDDSSDMTSTCGLDFERYQEALKAMGFRDAPIHDDLGRLADWRYYKGDITLSLRVQQDADQPDGTKARACLKSITTLN